MQSRHRVLLGIPALLVFAILLPASAAELTGSDGDAALVPAPPDPAESRYLALGALPEGDAQAGGRGVRRSAIGLAASLRAIPVAEGSATPCPRDRLSVRWDEPGESYGHGAFVEPLGPPPSDETSAVNGIVVCAGSDWAFMGFEARYVGGRWDVVAVPFVSEGEDHDHDAADAGEAPGRDGHHDHAAEAAAGAGGPEAAPSALPAGAGLGVHSFSAPIEGYARYEPQRTCSPTAKPGTLALQHLLLDGAPGSRSLGISRACHIGGSSEHKEERALDWGVLVQRSGERAAADAFLARLLATDEAGNRHALARRMGVMYVIWNRQIWSAYRPHDGWRPYSGASPHTDHVHVSLSWDGALGRTSYWSGQVVPGLDLAAAPHTHPRASGTAAAAPASGPTAAGPATATAPAPTSDGGGSQGVAHDAHQAALEEQHRQHKAAEEEARRQRKAAEDDARRRHQEAAEELRRQHGAAKDAERGRHQEAKEAERRQRQQAAPPSASPAPAQRSAPPAAAPAPAPRGNGGGGGGGGGGKGKGG